MTALLSGDLDPHALSEAQRILAELRGFPLRSGEFYGRVPLHWAVEDYGCDDQGAYNGVVQLQGGLWVATVNGDPRRNAREPAPDGYAAHTAGANGVAFGIAVDGMVDATPSDFGGEPVQYHELEVLCAFAGAVGKWAQIDLMGQDQPSAQHYGQRFAYGFPNCATHALFAARDGYFPGDGFVSGFPESGPPYRWDLARFRPSALPLSIPEAVANVRVLRDRAHQYKLALT